MTLPRNPIPWALSPELLHGRMAFIAGPRQVGKTTAINDFLRRAGDENLYYNWDTPTVKKRYAKDANFFAADIPADKVMPWLVFDEIHKYPKWKNLMKGYFDEWHRRLRLIVTGSARLDSFRRSGDSLVGRYFLYRMLPLGPRDVTGTTLVGTTSWHPLSPLPEIPECTRDFTDATNTLLRLTGFPEPFYAASADFYNRWREDYASLILREDLRDLTRIIEISKMETLLYLLPERVGSPLSINNLRHVLECAHSSMRGWLQALELVYLTFTVPPWTTRLARGITKEKKLYFWDWGVLDDPGARLENFVAVMLSRAIAAWNEWGKGPYRLFYLRNRDGLEADFAVADRKRVRLVIEVKCNDDVPSRSLVMFREQLKADVAVQLINRNGYCKQHRDGLFVIGTERFLSLLP